MKALRQKLYAVEDNICMWDNFKITVAKMPLQQTAF